jgi:hypothetical protein
MRVLSLIGAAGCLVPLAWAQPPLPAPIAEANAGKWQCYVPDIARKTCQSLGGYKAGKNGAIDNTAIVLIAPQPVITMETVSPVSVKAGRVCGPLRAQDIDAATVRRDGKTLEMQQSAGIKAQMKTALGDMLGREVCTAYLPQNGMLLARGSVDGVEKPELDQPVLWVSPADGFKVGP